MTDGVDTLASQVSELIGAVGQQKDYIIRLIEMTERQWRTVERLVERQE